MNLALQYKDTQVLERTEVCCSEFEPSDWDYAQHDWKNKLFLKASVLGLLSFLVPGAHDKAIARMSMVAKQAKALPRNGNTLVLTQEVSPFRSELFMEVTGAIPNQNTTRLNGTFISRVFEGSNNKTSSYIRGLDGYLASLGKMAKKYYFYYPYCSSCARKHGHHFVVAIAETKALDPYIANVR